MATIITRETGATAKGSPLTNAELDNNFINLDNDTAQIVDIGTAPNQVPLNQYLGGMAFQHPESVVIRPATSAVPAQAGSMVFQLTSDTSLTVKVRGADGVVRSATLPLT